MIYVRKQEGLYQNKVNSSLISLCRSKMACYLDFKISRLWVWVTEAIVEVYV